MRVFASAVEHGILEPTYVWVLFFIMVMWGKQVRF